MVSEGSPDKRAPAPLDLVQRFVNTVDLEDGDEELFRPEALGQWLADRDLIGPDEPVTEGDLRRAIDVREGLRALMLANNGHPLDEAAVERMNRAASRSGMVLRVDRCAPRL